jgi:hypothetical protein
MQGRERVIRRKKDVTALLAPRQARITFEG